MAAIESDANEVYNLSKFNNGGSTKHFFYFFKATVKLINDKKKINLIKCHLSI